ncbi:MAG: class I SAM-dependent methyltransferase [Candidatus Omnitrophica bacterium]|nr:class I SAM-dependent methyltransferase [Candidatus Omnitrophota bacterium]
MSLVQMQLDTRQLSGTLDRSKEQLIPGHDSDYWLEFHLTFYRFAEQLCGGQVLDIGCGYGYGSNHLARIADHVTGIDYHTPAIDFAKEKYQRDNLTFLQHDANKPLPFEDDTFDLIVSSEVLEHIANQEALIQEVKRVGKKGKFVIFKTPQSVDGAEDDNPHHHHTFTYEEFEKLFKENFTKANVFFWVQKTELIQKKIKVNLERKVEKFGDPFPSEYAILIHSLTTPALIEPDANNRVGDLFVMCEI